MKKIHSISNRPFTLPHCAPLHLGPHSRLRPHPSHPRLPLLPPHPPRPALPPLRLRGRRRHRPPSFPALPGPLPSASQPSSYSPPQSGTQEFLTSRC